jgi:nicotinate-nucleotide adenylyltransferase
MIEPRITSAHAFAGLTIGLLGGSFNPAHEGHLAMSKFALRRLDLDQVWWLVTPQNPLKAEVGMASLDKRLAEARRLTRQTKILVTDIEKQLKTRYTVDTLRALKKRFPKTNFVWLMGADNLCQMPRWHKWPEIFRLAPVAVFRRPAYAAGRNAGKAAQRYGRSRLRASQSKELAGHKPPAWIMLDNILNSTSATEIRRKN